MRSFFFFLLCLMSFGTASAQTAKKEQCSQMRSGTFRYLESEDPTAYFVITDTSHTEYYNDGKYNIQSRMTWEGDCQYSLLMTSSNVPGFPFQPGATLKVTITRVEKEVYYYTAEVEGQRWTAKVKKIK